MKWRLETFAKAGKCSYYRNDAHNNRGHGKHIEKTNRTPRRKVKKVS